MKRHIICAALSIGLAAMPIAASARGYHGHGGDYRGHGGYYHGHGNGLVHALALPLIATAAVVGAVATIASAPFEGPRYVSRPRVYYAPQPAYSYAPPAYGYAPAPPAYGYAPPPAYGYAPQTCTYYPNGATYCR